MLPEIPRGRFTWIRLSSHGWVEQALQSSLIEFVTSFEAEHSWVERGSMYVEERFSDTGVHVRVPRGPTAPAERIDNFLQRSGVPFVIIRCKRERDQCVFEVAVPFPLGNDQEPGTLLLAVRESLRAQEFQSRA